MAGPFDVCSLWKVTRSLLLVFVPLLGPLSSACVLKLSFAALDWQLLSQRLISFCLQCVATIPRASSLAFSCPAGAAAFCATKGEKAELTQVGRVDDEAEARRLRRGRPELHHRRPCSARALAMTEYHKAPKQVSNDWSRR